MGRLPTPRQPRKSNKPPKPTEATNPIEDDTNSPIDDLGQTQMDDDVHEDDQQDVFGREPEPLTTPIPTPPYTPSISPAFPPPFVCVIRNWYYTPPPLPTPYVSIGRFSDIRIPSRLPSPLRPSISFSIFPHFSLAPYYCFFLSLASSCIHFFSKKGGKCLYIFLIILILHITIVANPGLRNCLFLA
jgi:hypothetical protein